MCKILYFFVKVLKKLLYYKKHAIDVYFTNDFAIWLLYEVL